MTLWEDRGWSCALSLSWLRLGMKQDLFRECEWLHAFCLGSGRKTYKALKVMYCTEIALLQGLTLRVRLLVNKQIKQTNMHMHVILTLTRSQTSYSTSNTESLILPITQTFWSDVSTGKPIAQLITSDLSGYSLLWRQIRTNRVKCQKQTFEVYHLECS